LERRGLHAWHPYYAGFSETFVADIFKKLGLREGQLVLDPMNGSGTTTIVAQQNGLLALGVELNPAMATIARAKDASLSTHKLEEAAQRVIEKASRLKRSHEPDPEAIDWFSPLVLSDLKRIEQAIDGYKEQSRPLPFHPQLEQVLQTKSDVSGGGVKDFLHAALLLTARRFSNARSSKNPTWLKQGTSVSDETADVLHQFVELAAQMAQDLAAAFGTSPPKMRQLLILNKDARQLPLVDSSVDAIVTSPPYLTRIDYTVGTSPELVALGYETTDKRTTLRHAIMGSTCITGGSYEVQECWGETCALVLERVRTHHSKASGGYYFKNHVQYFRDAEALLRQCLRVLKPNAPAILVVQDSWYKDVHIPLGTIYAEMAMCLGANSAKPIHSEPIRSHLGLVNTRARRYPKGELHEYVIQIQGKPA
jgi:DNA modification methylase